MKKQMMLFCVVMATTISLWAETETVNGYTWQYRINGDSVEIFGYSSYVSCVSPHPDGFVTIPSSLGGKPVTIIGENAFRDCRSMTGVSIPKSVTEIGMSAFDGCHKLRNVTIPNGVTSIGDWAFCHCFELKNVIIPNSVMNIGYQAFCGCGLVGIAIPSSVVGIGDEAFRGCDSLRDAILSKRFKNRIGRIFCRYNGYNFNVSFPDEHEVTVIHKEEEERGGRNWYGW